MTGEMTSQLMSFPARHAFFTRKGGVSEGVYDGLNVGLGSDDDHDTVLSNRALAMQTIDMPRDALTTLYQIHSSIVHVVDAPHAIDARLEGDAMVTKMPGIVLGILTADCGPVLFIDKEAGVIGAAHAGWKGAVSGVLDNTIEAMCHLGASKAHIHAAIGPLISVASYEVGADFKSQLLKSDAAAEEYFPVHPQSGKVHFDLRAYITHRLKLAGLTHIHHLADDTYMLSEKYYSYRRSVHKKEADYGRGLSAIWL